MQSHYEIFCVMLGRLEVVKLVTSAKLASDFISWHCNCLTVMGLILPLLHRGNFHCLCFRVIISTLGAYGSVIWHFIQWSSGCQNIPGCKKLGDAMSLGKCLFSSVNSRIRPLHFRAHWFITVLSHLASLPHGNTHPCHVQQCSRKSKTRRSPGQY